MRRGLESIGVILILAVSWISICRLYAGSASVTAQVSIIIPERPHAAAAMEPNAGAVPSPAPEMLAALPSLPATQEQTITVRRQGRLTVLHTAIPEL